MDSVAAIPCHHLGLLERGLKMLEKDRSWSDIKAQEQIIGNGVSCSLMHLQDVECHFRIPARGKYPELEIILIVIVSRRCVSWGPKRGEKIDFSIYGEDRRIIDEKGVHRCFDEARYLLSLHLPGIFKTFVERDCLFTGRRNWLTVEVLDSDGERQDYEIFFRIFRKSKRTLSIFADSAYVRDPGVGGKMPAPLIRGAKVRAKTLMTKTLRGERITQPTSGGKSRH